MPYQPSAHIIVIFFESLNHFAFRACHSTETALTKEVNDFLLRMDSDSTSVLFLLALSVAFDTADHCLLLDQL